MLSKKILTIKFVHSVGQFVNLKYIKWYSLVIENVIAFPPEITSHQYITLHYTPHAAVRELWHISTDTLFMNGQQLAPTKPPKLPPTRLIESDSWNATRNVLILLIWPKEGTRLKHNNTPAERALEIGNTHRRVYTVSTYIYRQTARA